MPQKGSKVSSTGSHSSFRKTLRGAASPAPPAVRAGLPTRDLPRLLSAYVQEGVYLRLSPRTQEARQSIVGKLVWFLDNEGHAQCGQAEIRAFLTYLATGHQDKGGRWGLAPEGERFCRAPAASTLKTYHTYLRAFFGWCVDQDLVDVHPMARIKPPRVPDVRQQPFTPADLAALEAAAKHTCCPRRDTAILLLLWDTGLRVSECAALTMGDVDIVAKTLLVRHGKGDKERVVSFGLRASRALWEYLRSEKRDWTTAAVRDAEGECARRALFEMAAGHGRRGNLGLTASGTKQMMERLTAMAGITRPRRGCHTLRNTFASSVLRDGMAVQTAQAVLGHTTAAMTYHYAAPDQGDVCAAQRRHSPVDNAKKKGKRGC